MKFTTLLGAVSIAALTTGLNAQDADLLVFDYSGFELPEHHAAYIAKYGQSPTFAFFGDEDDCDSCERALFELRCLEPMVVGRASCVCTDLH